MIVVADTSPLNYLVLLGHIEILAKIYAEVVVPLAVLEGMEALEIERKRMPMANCVFYRPIRFR